MPRGPHCRAYYSNCAVISHFTCQTAYVTGLDGMSYCNQTLLLPEAGVWAWDYVWVCLLLLVGHVMCEWGEMCEWDNCFMLSPSPHRRWCRCKQWNAGGGELELVLSPDPTYGRGSGDIWPIPWLYYFLERNFSPPITLQKRQSIALHRKFLATSTRWHSTFLAHYRFSTMHTASYEFLMKPKESAGCHQTLSYTSYMQYAIGKR